MIDPEAFVENQKASLQLLRDSWSVACEQMALLTRLSLHHGQAMGRSAVETAYETGTSLQSLMPRLASPGAADAMAEYVRDCGQRWILFLDTLCRRGDACAVREQEDFKPVLAFDYDVIVDGRKLGRPVNYTLVRIKPPEDTSPPSVKITARIKLRRDFVEAGLFHRNRGGSILSAASRQAGRRRIFPAAAGIEDGEDAGQSEHRHESKQADVFHFWIQGFHVVARTQSEQTSFRKKVKRKIKPAELTARLGLAREMT